MVTNKLDRRMMTRGNNNRRTTDHGEGNGGSSVSRRRREGWRSGRRRLFEGQVLWLFLDINDGHFGNGDGCITGCSSDSCLTSKEDDQLVIVGDVGREVGS